MNISAFIKINPADSVVVCLRPIDKGETINVDGKEITVLQNTPAGHKILIKDTPANVNIIKYGYPIGHAKEDLKQGQWVNENNLKTNLSGTLTYEYCPVNEKLDIKGNKLRGNRRCSCLASQLRLLTVERRPRKHPQGAA